jgi:uncharacterized protein (DUF1684 family)
MRRRTGNVTLRFVLLVLFLLAIAACTRRQEPAPGPVVMDAAEQEHWEIALVEMRIEKNETFMDPEQSPLPNAVRTGFEGLDYYYPHPGLRYHLPFERSAAVDTVLLERRQGGTVAYLEVGSVTFRYEHRNYTLAVFAPPEPDGEGALWLPFYDETNVDETYPGGRYLDLEPGSDGTVEVDFNYAYNPLCAYDPERYQCVLPPQQNRLTFRVEAGEKRFGGES